MRILQLVTLKHGPACDTTRPLREQKGWTEHAEFMDALVAEKFVVPDEAAIRKKLDADPWHRDGHLEIVEIERWTVLLHAEQRG